MGGFGSNFGSNFAVFTGPFVPTPATKTITADLCVITSSKADLCV